MNSQKITDLRDLIINDWVNEIGTNFIYFGIKPKTPQERYAETAEVFRTFKYQTKDRYNSFNDLIHDEDNETQEKLTEILGYAKILTETFANAKKQLEEKAQREGQSLSEDKLQIELVELYRNLQTAEAFDKPQEIKKVYENFSRENGLSEIRPPQERQHL